MTLVKKTKKPEPKIEKSVFEKMTDIMAEQKKSIEQLTAAVEKQEQFFSGVEQRLDKLVKTDKAVHDEIKPDEAAAPDKQDELKDKIETAEIPEQ
jgi:uncharacterized coiled-coil protein SlyX